MSTAFRQPPRSETDPASARPRPGRPGSGAGKDAVALVALVAAAGWTGWLLARQTFELNATWTDGEQPIPSLATEAVRHAIWDDPTPLGDGLDVSDRLGRPALSPDGRLVVFAVGERGLNVELWVAEWDGEQARAERPLSALNSGADDLAPAFGADALWFASDRGGPEFGLDLWRVPYSDGHFGHPAAAWAGINSAADDTDPFPVPGTQAVVFASNRSRGARIDFDLFGAVAPPGQQEGTQAPWIVGALAQVNSPFDEREPSLTPDRRTLLFASDRNSRSAVASHRNGDFDLYRSFQRGDDLSDPWLTPRALVGLNSRASERAPLPTEGGFALWFERGGRGDSSALVRARTRELFRLPQPPLSLRDLLVLIVLVSLGVLALLAKRWHAIDVIYKCLLISLLVHMALLLWFREVVPEAEQIQPQTQERTFRVRLSSEVPQANAAEEEHAGELEVQRLEAQAEPLQPERNLESGAPAHRDAAEPQPRQPMHAAQGAQESTPRMARSDGREQRQRPSQSAAHPRGLPLAQPARLATATTSSAPKLRLDDRPAPGADTRQESSDPAHPTRPQQAGLQAPVAAARPAQSARARTAEMRGQDLPQAPDRGTGPVPAPRTIAREGKGDLAQQLLGDLAGPSAPPTPDRTERPTFEVARTRAQEGAPARSDTSAPVPARRGNRSTATLAPGSAKPGAKGTLETTNEIAEGDRTRSPNRVPLDGPASPGRAPAEFALRSGTELPQGLGVSSDAGSPTAAIAQLALDGPRAMPTRHRADAAARPGRLAARSPEPLSDRTSRPKAGTLVTAPQSVAPTIARSERGGQRTAYSNRFGDARLRALEEFGGGIETEAAVARGLQYLASVQNPNGSWGDRRDFDRRKYRDVRIGKTGLALLAFLGAGHLPAGNSRHAAVSEAAVDYLVALVSERTGHIGDGSSYSHAIATYALAECYALTDDDDLRAPLTLAVARILVAQDRSRDPARRGGWGYYFSDGAVWDNDRWPRVSVTVWQIMALESARLGGLGVPDDAFDAAGDFLRGAWDGERGAYRYNHDPSRLNSRYDILPASTPAALFGLSLLGTELESRALRPAWRFINERRPDGYRFGGDDAFVFRAEGNLYFWYYGSLACFRRGGSTWERWNIAMQETLLPAQEEDGSWEPLSTYARYAGDDDRERSYTTALSVLTLEIYYRYFTPLLRVR